MLWLINWLKSDDIYKLKLLPIYLLCLALILIPTIYKGQIIKALHFSQEKKINPIKISKLEIYIKSSKTAEYIIDIFKI